MKGYTTKAAIENYTLQSIDASFADQIDSWIEAMENFIDQQTGRNFIADTEAVEKIYDGNGKIELIIDDFISLTSLEIGEDDDDTRELIDADDYRIYPANETPKRKIQLKDGYFTTGNQNIIITAKFGYSAACPADITLAATIFMAGIVNYANNAKGKVASESIGRYSVSYDNDKGWQDFRRSLTIINSYKKYTF